MTKTGKPFSSVLCEPVTVLVLTLINLAANFGIIMASKNTSLRIPVEAGSKMFMHTQMASSENDGAICGALEGVTGLQSSKIWFVKNRGSRTQGPGLESTSHSLTARCDSSITYLPLACSI